MTCTTASEKDDPSIPDEIHSSLTAHESATTGDDGSELFAGVPGEQLSTNADKGEPPSKPGTVSSASDKDSRNENVQPEVEEADEEIVQTADETVKDRDAANDTDVAESLDGPEFLEDLQDFPENYHDFIQNVQESSLNLQEVPLEFEDIPVEFHEIPVEIQKIPEDPVNEGVATDNPTVNTAGIPTSKPAESRAEPVESRGDNDHVPYSTPEERARLSVFPSRGNMDEALLLIRDIQRMLEERIDVFNVMLDKYRKGEIQTGDGVQRIKNILENDRRLEDHHLNDHHGDHDHGHHYHHYYHHDHEGSGDD